MSLYSDSLPAKPFFTCSAKGLAIVDAGLVKNQMQLGSLEPWMVFECGVGNMIDSVPRKVTSWGNNRVVVECTSGAVHLDFGEGGARKVTAQGEFVYLGGMEERNEGRGYMPVS